MNTRNVLLIAALLLFFKPTLAADTAMFRDNAGHVGVYGGRGRTDLAGLKWAFHAKGAFTSSPAVVGAIAYAGNGDGNLYAIDSETGALKWQFATGSRVGSSPAVVNGVVYFASYDSYFYAVDALSGKLKWKFKTNGEHRFTVKHLHGLEPADEIMPDPWDCYLSSPLVWKSSVYFGSGDGNIYALDATTGERQWAFKTGDVVHASPAIAGGTLYIGSWDSYFYALDDATGKEVWRFKTGDDPATHNQTGIQSSAAVVDGTVFFGARDSHLYAVDAQTGTKKWDYFTNYSWVNNSPAVKNGAVFFGTSDSGLLYGLDKKTGKVTLRIALNNWPIFSSPAIAGDMIYVGQFGGQLRAIDLTSRSIAWTFETDASKKNAPAITKSDGSVDFNAAFPSNFYDDGVAGYLTFLKMGAFLSSPVITDNVLYIGSADGNLYALRLKTAGK